MSAGCLDGAYTPIKGERGERECNSMGSNQDFWLAPFTPTSFSGFFGFFFAVAIVGQRGDFFVKKLFGSELKC